MGKQLWELLERRTLLAAAGDLDTTFNSTGIVTQQFDNVTINKLAVQSDSKIVIVGAIGAGPSGSTPGTRDFFLARFNADGSLDHSFGTNNTGTVQTDFGGDDIANDIAIDAVGRIVVAGGGSPGPSAGADFAIARYTSDGKLDTTFNGTGKRLIDFGADEQAIALVVSTNNKITLAGEKPDAHAAPIARLNPDGSLDNSFSTDGIDQLSFCARVSDLALDPSGRIVLAAQFLAGGTTVEALAARLLDNGSPDPTFGSGGVAETGGGEEDSLAIAAPTDDVVVISTISSFDFLPSGPCYIISDNGTLVQSFGIPGDRATAIKSIFATPDLRLVLGAAGSVSPPEDGSGNGQYASLTIAEFDFLSTASPQPPPVVDTTFARTGVTNLPAFNSGGLVAAAMDPQRRIVAVGNFADSTITGNVMIARYLSIPEARPFAWVSSRGVLHLEGSAQDDNIVVSQRGNRVTATLNGSSIPFIGRIKHIVIDAGDGNDIVTLSKTAATILGGDGNDTLVGSGLADSIDGGAGDDTIQGLGSIDPLNGDTLTGGGGTDLADYGERTTSLTFKIGGQIGASVRVGNDVHTDYFDVIQSAGWPDRFDVDPAAVIPHVITLRGQGGNDFFNIRGMQAIVAEGDFGNDRFELPGPNVTVQGGYGNDSIRLFDLPASLDGGKDIDTIIETVVAQIPKLDLNGTRVENAIGSGLILGNELPNNLSAVDGADGVIFYGMDGNDTLIGSAASDNLTGNDGDDLLEGGGGDDRLHGNDGNDTLVGNRGKDHLWADAGDDLLLARGDRARHRHRRRRNRPGVGR